MSKQLDNALIWETVRGQVIGKANSYMVANNEGSRHIIKNDRCLDKQAKEQRR